MSDNPGELVDLDAMTFEAEVAFYVELGEDPGHAEFLAAMRRGEVEGDTHEEPTS